MRAVLSDALPALDTERLTVIAESMERIADLEKQLQSTRAEAAVLDTTEKVYRRYLTSIAQLEAAALSAANNDFDDHARKVREATANLKDAQDGQKELERKHTNVREHISELEGQKEAADTALRDHAGAELLIWSSAPRMQPGKPGRLPKGHGEHMGTSSQRQQRPRIRPAQPLAASSISRS